MRDARKLFRLFKSVNEYQKIAEILNKGSIDQVEFFLSIANRLGFLLYWFFDNLVILCKVKFLNHDSAAFNKAGSTYWFLALLAALISSLRSLYANINKVEWLRQSYKRSQEEKVKEELKTTLKARKDIFLNILKTLGDMITSSQASEIFPKLTGKNFNDGWIGMGGFVSAVITGYQLF